MCQETYTDLCGHGNSTEADGAVRCKQDILVGVRSVITSFEGKRIVSGSSDQSVWVRKHDGSVWCSELVMEHTGWVKSVSIS